MFSSLFHRTLIHSQRLIQPSIKSHLRVPIINNWLSSTSYLFCLGRKSFSTLVDTYKVVVAAQCRSKYDNVKKTLKVGQKANCGEDAYFVTVNKQITQHCSKKKLIAALGVADGVGGYTELGIDPTQMAWQVMNNTENNFLKSITSKIQEDQDLVSQPKELLIRAYNEIITEKQVDGGGTTACIVSIFSDDIKEDGNCHLMLQYANIGDSGFMVVRQGKIIFRSKEQLHGFNIPFQLVIPLQGDTFYDRPTVADTFPPNNLLRLQAGDYIILGTDGLWDNLFDEHIVKILVETTSRFTEIGQKVDETAKEILKVTTQISKSQTIETPFSQYCRKNSTQYSGGKIDDITIVVACVHK